MSDFVKFPRTPHLFVLEGLDIRDDKVLPPAEAAPFFTNPVIVEEKVDGANVGISLDGSGELRVQNRGDFVTPDGHPQFRPIWPWAYERMHLFQEHLGTRFILFGEWCFVKHSILYDNLPDWFLGFDIYDRDEGCFLSTSDRDAMFSKLNVTPIECLSVGIHSQSDIEKILEEKTSAYATSPIEGVYIRLEVRGRLKSRAKVVRGDFIQSIGQHWSKGAIQVNRRTPVTVNR